MSESREVSPLGVTQDQLKVLNIIAADLANRRAGLRLSQGKCDLLVVNVSSALGTPPLQDHVRKLALQEDQFGGSGPGSVDTKIRS